MITRSIVYLVTTCIALIGLNAAAPARQSDSGITVKGAWIQQAPPSQKMTAAFMTVENHSAKEKAIISAKSNICKVVELHKIENVNEVMKMQKVNRVVVPAKGQVEFKPGGYRS